MKMESRRSFGGTGWRQKTYVHSLKIRLLLPLLAQIWTRRHLLCVSKLPSNWTRSGALVMGSSGSMQLTILPNIKISSFLRSSPGTGGDAVRDHSYCRCHRAYFPNSGVPVAWMLASNGTKDTISFFVRWVRDGSPAVMLAMIMTDRDLAQIGTLKIVYPDSQIFLCKWHVLRAMQSYINANELPELWSKIRALVSTPDEKEFDRLWGEISSDPSCPTSFSEYMKVYWISDKEKWSLVYRKNRSIFEEGDTNMLIEAYVFFFISHMVNL